MRMHTEFPGYVCPSTGGALHLTAAGYVNANNVVFPIVAGIPRFVDSAGYTDSFSFQWNKFAQTQIDDGMLKQSGTRLWTETGWSPHSLKGQEVLEVGSGAGRFTRVFLSASDAQLASVDYSEAVQANYANNRNYVEQGRLALAQASIYELPYRNGNFDKVFCLGVLQHTPDFRESLKCLLDKVRPGGELVVDFYPINGWWTKINAKYIFRPILKRMPSERLLWMLTKAMPSLIAAYRVLKSVGLGVLTRFLPICDIDGTLPAGLSRDKLLEWCILDTFDMFSPAYDNPQRIATVARWLGELGAEVRFAGPVRFDGHHKAAVVRVIKRGG